MDVEGFFRNIDEKHSEVLSSLDSYFDIVITSSNLDKKEEVLLNLGKAAELLAAQMASKDQPQWLHDLIYQVEVYKSNLKSDLHWKAAFDKIKANERAMRGQQWLRSRSTATPIIDFDAIVEKHRDKETIEKLFDSLIDTLEKLIKCEELDSRRVAEDLARLLATLRNSEKGSFNAQILSWSVAKKYVKNLGKSWLKETKTAKIFISAAEETVDQLGLTLDEAKKNIQAEISEVENGFNQRLWESGPKQIGADYLPGLDADIDVIAIVGNTKESDSSGHSESLSGQMVQLPKKSKD